MRIWNGIKLFAGWVWDTVTVAYDDFWNGTTTRTKWVAAAIVAILIVF